MSFDRNRLSGLAVSRLVRYPDAVTDERVLASLPRRGSVRKANLVGVSDPRLALDQCYRIRV